jgi:8-oxo-dGTP pyrophosphatase MutT (NUDIX family)
MSDLEKVTMWDIVYRGSLFCIEKHREKDFERAVRPPGVRLLLTNNEGKILLTREFRSELGTVDVRVPGGKVLDSLKEFLAIREDAGKMNVAVFTAARLEAKQETGVDEIENLTIFHTSTLGASVDWPLYYMTGTITAHSQQELEPDEAERGIDVHFFTLDEVRELLAQGEIREERSAAVLAKYLNIPSRARSL